MGGLLGQGLLAPGTLFDHALFFPESSVSPAVAVMGLPPRLGAFKFIPARVEDMDSFYGPFVLFDSCTRRY